ncbi:MAG: hypothetical protein Q9162_005970 [Coniocarpon cinnabarinum]
MSRFCPRAEYAEDQPWGKTVLAAHVLHRGFQSGALLGSVAGALRFATTQRTTPTSTSSASANSTMMRKPQVSSTSSSALSATSARPQITGRLIAGAGTGSVVGTVIATIALWGRMNGREDIEWRDRSWRLLQNRGQVEVDDWSIIGAVAGAAGSSVIKGAAAIPPWKRLLGGAGLGNVAGVAAYMVWRYGVHGGNH